MMRMTKTWVAASALVAAAFGPAVSSEGALAHRYSMSQTGPAGTSVLDSVGTAHGTLLANGTLDGDLLTTAGTAGAASGVSLPITAVQGLTGDFSIEQWATTTTAGAGTSFQTLFAFGVGGAPGNRNAYLLATGRRGSTGNPSGVGVNPVGGPTGDFAGEVVVTGPAFVANTPTQFVFTYRASDNQIQLFVNGVLTDTDVSPLPLSFEAVGADFRGINGNNPIDPAFTGSTDDFRIYNNTLAPAAVAQLNTLGPDAGNSAINTASAVPEPASVGLLGLGALGLLVRRSHRRRA